jgi:hypothetical protein
MKDKRCSSRVYHIQVEECAQQVEENESPNEIDIATFVLVDCSMRGKYCAIQTYSPQFCEVSYF